MSPDVSKPEPRPPKPPSLASAPGDHGSGSKTDRVFDPAAGTGPAAGGDQPQTSWWRRQCSLRETAGFLISLALHVVLLVILSLLVLAVPASRSFTLLVANESGDSLLQDDDEPTQAISIDASAALIDSDLSSLVDVPAPALSTPEEVVQAVQPVGSQFSSTQDFSASLMLQSRAPSGGGFSGRSAERRGDMLAQEGGTGESERAVALALEWIAAHQFNDGGWRLEFETGPCQGQCRNSGTIGTTTGATGLALLPFLGAGFTHQNGEYRDVVHEGLYYLKSRMVKTQNGGDLQEGTMYAQGIATIALCEAYAMTRDEALRPTAQEAVDFICKAQHSGGGWRYLPGMPGDTTVTGWQMMALKSAHMAGLSVPSPTVNLVERFLDSVQTSNGAFYGYVARGKNPGPTAVGLLLRMYSGWNQDDARLVRGVAYLAGRGPSRTDMYFNYYATQVIHHQGGPAWPKWNVPMREHLIQHQSQRGHERGSWHFEDRHGLAGGRLYTTAMCAMILEVYYRHMPLYAEQAVEDDL